GWLALDRSAPDRLALELLILDRSAPDRFAVHRKEKTAFPRDGIGSDLHNVKGNPDTGRFQLDAISAGDFGHADRIGLRQDHKRSPVRIRRSVRERDGGMTAIGPGMFD